MFQVFLHQQIATTDIYVTHKYETEVTGLSLYLIHIDRLTIEMMTDVVNPPNPTR